MALKKDTIEKLKTVFKLDYDKLVAAMADPNEVDYELPAVEVLTTDELTQRDTNVKAAAKKEGVTEGKTAGMEIAVKAVKKKYNLTSDEKDLDKVLTEVDTTIGKGDAGLKEQITLLQKDKERLEGEVNTEKGNSKIAKQDADIISMFPANVTEGLNNSERLALVKMNISVEEHEGKVVVKRNGEILRDKATQNPVTVKDAIAAFFVEKKWVSEEGAGGRGGGSSAAGGGGTGTAGIKKLTVFNEKWRAENPGLNDVSPEYDTALQTHMKATPDFNLSE